MEEEEKRREGETEERSNGYKSLEVRDDNLFGGHNMNREAVMSKTGEADRVRSQRALSTKPLLSSLEY